MAGAHVRRIQRLKAQADDVWTDLRTPRGPARIRSERLLDEFMSLLGGEPLGLPPEVARVVGQAEVTSADSDVLALVVETAREAADADG